MADNVVLMDFQAVSQAAAKYQDLSAQLGQSAATLGSLIGQLVAQAFFGDVGAAADAVQAGVLIPPIIAESVALATLSQDMTAKSEVARQQGDQGGAQAFQG